MDVLWSPPEDMRQQQFRELARGLTETHFIPLAHEIDRDQRYPWESVETLRDSGLCGLLVPQEHGGQGADLRSAVGVMEELARGCASTSAILAIYLMGTVPLIREGSEAQREAYLPAIAAGNATSFALTEVGAGSDPSAIRTTATPSADGWQVSGEKWYIGNGGASANYVVFARTPERSGGRGFTAFMVSLKDHGVKVDRYADRMGLRGALTSNLKIDATVPEQAVLGEVGEGLRLAFQTLNPGRISVAAQALGIATAAFEQASAEACRRETFGRPIIDNQSISFRLADIATEISAARMMTWEAASAYDRGEDARILASMAKLYASEVSHRAVDLGVQVFGGDGYCKPNPIERMYRDQRIIEIYEGSSEIQRLSIARHIRREASA